MNFDLENAIKSYNDRNTDFSLSQDNIITLLKWYDGNIFNQNNERIKNAIAVLAWCYNKFEEGNLYPIDPQNTDYENVAKAFNINSRELLDLILSYNKIFNIQEKKTAIIAFEGIDGCGKSIQINAVAEKLEGLGFKVGIKSFPEYNSFFGTELGNLLSGNCSIRADVVDSKSMCLWYALDRWKSFQGFDYEGYDFLLLNRFTLSSAVYQSIRAGSDEQEDLINWIFELEHTQLKLPVPDIYLVFDVNTQMSKKNVLSKGHRDYVGEKADVYEESSELINNARDQYLKIASKLNNIKIINCIEQENTMKTPDEINRMILEVLTKCNLLNTIPGQMNL